MRPLLVTKFDRRALRFLNLLNGGVAFFLRPHRLLLVLHRQTKAPNVPRATFGAHQITFTLPVLDLKVTQEYHVAFVSDRKTVLCRSEDVYFGVVV